MFKLIGTKNKIPHTLSEQWHLFLCFAIILIYYSPYFILGKDANILIHDNLDSLVIWTKILVNSGHLFSSPSTPINQVLDGIPRSALYANYDLSLIWFKLFGTYWGYVFNKLLMSIIGFLGMYLLLSKYFLPNLTPKYIPAGTALIFGLLPFWSFTPSIAGLPFLLLSFLNMRVQKSSKYDWLIIMVYPFYSSLVLCGFFMIIVLVFIFLYDTIIKKYKNYKYLSGLILLLAMYVLSHIQVFYAFLIKSDYISIRNEFQAHSNSLNYAFSKFIKIFIHGRYDAESLHEYILIPIFLGLIIHFYKEKINKKIVFIILFIILTSIYYGINEWSIYESINEKLMAIIPIKLKRFHWLHPMFWYILFGFSLYYLSKYIWFGKYLVQIILIAQLYHVIKYHEIYVNKNEPTFNQFFAEKQFNEIKNYIGLEPSTYRVISLGIHPSISQYNGFYTLDGYFVDYPIMYKKKFREVIENELERDQSLKQGFDNWGSRCYAFSSEIGQKDLYVFDKKIQYKIEKLDFNFSKLKEIGGKYILSKASINPKYNPRLKYLKTFSDKNSFWEIYLYEII